MEELGDTRGDATKKGKPTRQRVRCWVFTIHTAEHPGALGAEVADVSAAGPAGDMFWDPDCQPWSDPALRYVVCGLEQCPETGRLHWQGYVECSVPLDLRRVKEVLGCSWVHLESRRGTQEQAIAYCKKADTGVGTDDGDKVLFEFGTPAQCGAKRHSKNENYSKVLEKGTYQEALSELSRLEPADYVRFRNAVETGLKKHFLQRTVFIRPRETFTEPFVDTASLKRIAFVFTGASGTGKTSYALAHFTTPYLVSHIDQLRDFNPLEHDGIVFDDMNFDHWPCQSCIHILDMEQDRFIHCRHSTGFIPRGMPRIFTSNKPVMKLFNYGSCEQEENAVCRRFEHKLINKSLY